VKEAYQPLADSLDMVAGGLMLLYGNQTGMLVARQVEKVRQAGCERKLERWRGIAAAVRRLSQTDVEAAAG
jgi:hypothetical protein